MGRKVYETSLPIGESPYSVEPRPWAALASRTAASQFSALPMDSRPAEAHVCPDCASCTKQRSGGSAVGCGSVDGGGAGGAGGASLNEVLAGGGARAKPADEARLEAALLPDEQPAPSAAQPGARAADGAEEQFGDGFRSPAAAEVASVLRAGALRPPPPADARKAALFCCTMALISM